MLRRCVFGPHHVPLFVELHAGQRRRLDGKRLRRRIPLARHFAFRHGALLDAEDRLAVGAIEDVHQAGLPDQRERGNRSSVLPDVHHHRRRRLIGIPQVVMHGLEVPLVLPGLHIDGHDGIRKQVGAGTIAAPVVGRRTADRHVEDAALLIEGLIPAPVVDAGPSLPSLVQPRLVPLFSRPRHGVEFPQLRARAGIERTRVARRPVLDFPRRGAQHDDVLVDGRHAVPRHRDLGLAVLSEAARQIAGRGIQRDELRTGGEDDAGGILSIARPERDAARGRRRLLRQLVTPQLLACFRVEREDAIALRGQDT